MDVFGFDIDDMPPTTVLWRYIGFCKFVSMLQTSSLYFCPLDKLQDTYEGRYPEKWKDTFCDNADHRRMLDEALRREGLVAGTPAASEAEREFIRQSIEVQEEANRKALINCWCSNEVESNAMWKVFLDGEAGVAIKTTAEKLEYAWERGRKHGEDEGAALIVSPVQYVGNDDPIPENPIPCLVKRPFYSYEREVRAIWVPILESSKKYPNGRLLSVDLDILIDEVRLAPTVVPWFVDVVRKTLDIYGFGSKPVNTSEMV